MRESPQSRANDRCLGVDDGLPVSTPANLLSPAESRCPAKHDFYEVPLAAFRHPPNQKSPVAPYGPTEYPLNLGEDLWSSDITRSRVYFHFRYSSRPRVVDSSSVRAPLRCLDLLFLYQRRTWLPQSRGCHNRAHPVCPRASCNSAICWLLFS